MSYGGTRLGIIGGAGALVSKLFSFVGYTGNGGTLKVETSQDISGSGGVVWVKRTDAGTNHHLVDTVRGEDVFFTPNTTAAEGGDTGAITFESDGYTWNSGNGLYNRSGNIYSSFSWLINEGFVDVVEYTGNGANRTIAHSLNAVPTMMFVRRVNLATSWSVYHDNLTSAAYRILLDGNGGENLRTTSWNSTDPTDSVFSIGTDGGVNSSGAPYIAYLFAPKSGEADSGSYSGTTTINTGLDSISLFMVKRKDSIGDWYMFYERSGTWYHLKANTADTEATGLISVSGGDVTLSGAASSGNGIYYAWEGA